MTNISLSQNVIVNSNEMCFDTITVNNVIEDLNKLDMYIELDSIRKSHISDLNTQLDNYRALTDSLDFQIDDLKTVAVIKDSIINKQDSVNLYKDEIISVKDNQIKSYKRQRNYLGITVILLVILGGLK